MLFGILLKKSISSRTKLSISLRNGCNKISTKLLNLCVGQDGPATIGLNFKSIGLRISIYSDCCISIAFFIMDDL